MFANVSTTNTVNANDRRSSLDGGKDPETFYALIRDHGGGGEGVILAPQVIINDRRSPEWQLELRLNGFALGGRDGSEHSSHVSTRSDSQEVPRRKKHYESLENRQK